MKKTIFWKYGLLLSFLVMLSGFYGLSVNVAFAGFGISPPWIQNEHMIPGSSFESSITISQEKVDQPMKVKIDVSGDPVKKWIEVEGGNSVLISKGENKKQIKFKVSIPKDTKLGVYEGKIDFTAIPSADSVKKGQITVAVGAQAKIIINVGDKVFSDFKIIGVSIPNLEEGWPIKIGTKIDNIGNVETRPSRVLVRIWDNNHNYQLISGDLSKLTTVKPFSVGTSDGTIKADLKPGRYWADIEIYNSGKLALNDRFRFEVLPKYAITGKPILISIKEFLFETNFGIILMTFIVTLLLIFAGSYVKNRLKSSGR